MPRCRNIEANYHDATAQGGNTHAIATVEPGTQSPSIEGGGRCGMAWPNHSGVYIYMATLNVGAGQTYVTLSAAVGASRDGDVIAVQAGTYVNDFATISKDITTIGVGGMANFVAHRGAAQRQGHLRHTEQRDDPEPQLRRRRCVQREWRGHPL